MLSTWKNGITYTQDGHDLKLPTQDYVSLYQCRHYFFLRFPISDTNKATLQFVRGFGYQLFDGPKVIFDTNIELTVQCVYESTTLFGNPVLSFLYYSVVKERIRTSVINGEACDPIQIINSATTSGLIQDYNGNELQPDEVNALENPSFKHTLGGQRTSEFGTAILDTTIGVGTDEGVLDGRYEMPVYKLDVGPDTQVEITFDSLALPARRDLYQWRFSGTPTVDEIGAAVSHHRAIAIAAQGTNGGRLLYGGEPYVNFDRRATLKGLTNLTPLWDKYGRLYVIGLNKEAKICEERLSMDGGWTFASPPKGVIFKGLVAMPQGATVNDSTGERGVVAFQGNTLVYKSSRDNWAASVPIVDFKKPEPMALTQVKGVLRVFNGKGLLFVSYSGGGYWDNKSVVPVP